MGGLGRLRAASAGGGQRTIGRGPLWGQCRFGSPGGLFWRWQLLESIFGGFAYSGGSG